MCTHFLCFLVNIFTVCSWFMFTPFNTSVLLWYCNSIWRIINLLFCIIYVIYMFIIIWLFISFLFCVVYLIYMFFIRYGVYYFIIPWTFLVLIISTSVSVSYNFILFFFLSICGSTDMFCLLSSSGFAW